MSAGAVPLVYAEGGPAAIVDAAACGRTYRTLDELADETLAVVARPDEIDRLAQRGDRGVGAVRVRRVRRAVPRRDRRRAGAARPRRHRRLGGAMTQARYPISAEPNLGDRAVDAVRRTSDPLPGVRERRDRDAASPRTCARPDGATAAARPIATARSRSSRAARRAKTCDRPVRRLADLARHRSTGRLQHRGAGRVARSAARGCPATAAASTSGRTTAGRGGRATPRTRTSCELSFADASRSTWCSRPTCSSTCPTPTARTVRCSGCCATDGRHVFTVPVPPARAPRRRARPVRSRRRASSSSRNAIYHDDPVAPRRGARLHDLRARDARAPGRARLRHAACTGCGSRGTASSAPTPWCSRRSSPRTRHPRGRRLSPGPAACPPYTGAATVPSDTEWACPRIVL